MKYFCNTCVVHHLMSYNESKGSSVSVLWEAFPQGDHLKKGFFCSFCKLFETLERRPKGRTTLLNWRILKALTARGEVTRVQGNREESTPPFRELRGNKNLKSSTQRLCKHGLDGRILHKKLVFQRALCSAYNLLRKAPVKLSSLVALQGEHVGEEFVAWYVCNKK